MNKKKLENEIAKTQEQLKKLQAALDKAEKLEKEVPEELIFEDLDEYYYVDNTGDIYKTAYTHFSPGDVDRVHNRRAFLSKEYAEAFAQQTQFIAAMLHFKYLYDRDYEPNWDSEDEIKYCIYYNTRTKKFEWSDRTIFMTFECIYFSTRQLAERCADWLNKRVKEKCSNKYARNANAGHL